MRSRFDSIFRSVLVGASAISAAVLVVIAACTTQVPAIGSGGAGGASSGTMSTFISAAATTIATETVAVVGSATTGTAMGQCATTPVGNVVSFTSSISTGTGVIECSFGAHDGAGHQYRANCTVEGCDCQLDGVSVCKCLDTSPTNCSTGCCPAPWVGSP